MRDGVVADVAAVAVEADVGDVMLAATVEAAGNFYTEVADSAVEGRALGCQTSAEFAGQAARAGDAELAGVGAGAGGDVDDGAGAGIGQAEIFQFVVEVDYTTFWNPAENQVLFDGGAGVA